MSSLIMYAKYLVATTTLVVFVTFLIKNWDYWNRAQQEIPYSKSEAARMRKYEEDDSQIALCSLLVSSVVFLRWKWQPELLRRVGGKVGKALVMLPVLFASIGHWIRLPLRGMLSNVSLVGRSNHIKNVPISKLLTGGTGQPNFFIGRSASGIRKYDSLTISHTRFCVRRMSQAATWNSTKLRLYTFDRSWYR